MQRIVVQTLANDEKEKAAWQRLAKKMGMSVAATIRTLLNDECKKNGIRGTGKAVKPRGRPAKASSNGTKKPVTKKAAKKPVTKKAAKKKVAKKPVAKKTAKKKAIRRQARGTATLPL